MAKRRNRKRRTKLEKKTKKSENNFDIFEKISSIGNGDVFERLLDKLTVEGMFYMF